MDFKILPKLILSGIGVVILILFLGVIGVFKMTNPIAGMLIVLEIGLTGWYARETMYKDDNDIDI